jgi:hypothetical protein
MSTTVSRGPWRSADDLAVAVVSVDWAREVRRNEMRRAMRKVLSSLVGPLIRCITCGRHGAVLQFDCDETRYVWRCRGCRRSPNGGVS